jgi:hypothetical protein
MLLNACMAAHLALRYDELQTETEVDGSVFLAPSAESPRTVWIEERCMVSEAVTIAPPLRDALATRGYQIVETPDEATYLIQVSHRELTEFELSSGQTLSDALSASFTLAIGTGTAANLLGAGRRTVAGVSLAAGVIGFVADSRAKHIAHTLTTDLRITETLYDSGGPAELVYHERIIVSGASRSGLRLQESLPAMVSGTAQALTGIFP